MSTALHLFEGYGIEIEYMIVERDSLDVLALADQVIRKAAGGFVNEVERGALAWSNELALHVIEMKTNGPAPSLGPLPALFQAGVADIDAILAEFGGRLMPGAMHPWMNPDTETRLWPHEYNPIYESYNRIFDCRGHGWSNLQSMHVNLPFNGDDEFVRLHDAIRAALPVLPMLAASSPFADGRSQGLRDFRMHVYRGNAARIPSIAGAIVPEPVRSRAQYHEKILAPMYADIAPHDADGILQEEWLNSRGAIARFDRDAIEIRVLDTQENPRADLAVAAAVVGLVRELAEGRAGDLDALASVGTERLARVFDQAVEHAELAVVDDRDYLAVLGLESAGSLNGRDLWSRLVERAPPAEAHLHAPLEHILSSGTLSSRLLRAAGDLPNPDRLRGVYRVLCDCLAAGEPFDAENRGVAGR